MSLLTIIARPLLPELLKLLFSGLRVQLVPASEPLPDSRKGMIFAFWHGKMVAGWLLTGKLFPGKQATAVVSLSEDGQLLSDTLERLGFRLIRGSSSKGGREVKEMMLEALQGGTLVAMTPDGPRGPVNKFKYGTLRLASEHGIPMVFAEISFAKSRTLKSWDNFEIPMPFSKVTVTLHLIHLPEFHSEEELRSYCEKLSAGFSHA